MIAPRPYQSECLSSVLSRHAAGITRQLVSLPTGTGKTIIFALLAKHLNVKTLVIAHTEELLKQASDKFKFIWPEASIGIVKAAANDSDAQVVIASIQTASREARLKALQAQGFELLIIDEAHHAAASSYHKLIDRLGFMKGDPRKLLLGVTATPKRGDGVGLRAVFEEIVFNRSIGTMIHAGYLSPLMGRRVVTKTNLKGLKIAHGDFVAGQLSRLINTPDRNELIVQTAEKYASDRKRMIVFCADVQHATDLAASFTAKGIAAKAVFGAMPREERKQVLNDFASGQFQVLTNCQMLTEGFDLAEIDCVILARPTASASLYTQMIGRGTRIHPLKQDCLIIDFCDNTSRHQLCHFKNTLDGEILVLNDQGGDDNADECDHTGDAQSSQNKPYYSSLIATDRVEEARFFDRSDFAWVAVGESWHLSLTSNRDVWLRKDGEGYRVVANTSSSVIPLSDRLIPLNYAMGVAEDWARSQTTRGVWMRKDAPWRLKPATHKQIETLKRLGLDFSHPLTCGEAFALLDSRFNQPATEKQKYWLNSHGVSFDGSITKLQARKLISERAARM